MGPLYNQSRKRRRASTNISPAPSIPSCRDADNDVVMINGAGMEGSVPRERLLQTSTSRTKFIVGLDYGTTFSSVSYIKFDVANPPTTLRGEQIKSVYGWPNTSNHWRNPDVPSESWYLDDEFHWGYNARQEVKGIEDGRLDPTNRIIQFAKLLLVEDQPDKDGPRKELRRTLHKLNKTEKDVIKDYIRGLLKHSKTHLEKKERFTEDCEVEFVLCVPAGWPIKAIRTMQEILLEVAQEIGFGILAPLYILNEPEAAAAYMLEALSGCGNLKEGDVFIVCDAGGGTVDTITYRVRRERPFRVDEVVTPAGGNCGSSYVNQALKREVIRRIKDTEYASLKGPSFEYIIEHDVMNHFEYSMKRSFRPAEGLEGDEVMVVYGLTKDPRKGFGDSTLYIPRKQIMSFFKSSLDGVSQLIQGQINAVNEEGLTVSHILLVGGFSTSPAFLNHVQAKFGGLDILETEGDMATAVSHGAVFRALNKEYGPKRKIQSNFGFLQIEPYNKRLRAHRVPSTPTYHPVDGKRYIKNVLNWVIKKNQVLKTQEPFKTRNYQTFEMDEELVINQRIYVSDADNVRDHYQLGNRYNEGAESFGLLCVDLQKVKEEGLLQIKPGPRGDFYEIHYELAMEVDGRNLFVKLFCPPGGKCRGQTQLCIAAAFMPGTE
ncbi:hypothetical protein BDV41DRAFT_256217 [Aspergillus transmontanensis]|uniref:Actin-like ATPase domain-containing protein n=1 Tax=Aspergillus transmontanensis TaxID=1034304 RepID=A0A5N6VZ47_9EURO|nr:hypothetical protein BDV41DRAFT_256217 [Aspergillus transmontanensis]